MRLFDLFGRSRPRRAPRPRVNRVRCTVEVLEARLVLSGTDSITMTAPVVAPTTSTGSDTPTMTDAVVAPTTSTGSDTTTMTPTVVLPTTTTTPTNMSPPGGTSAQM